MKPTSRWLTRFTAGLLVVLLTVIAVAQGDWSLGDYKLLNRRPSPPLQVNLAEAGGLGSYSFVSSVGGVAFAGVASPGPAFQAGAPQLIYNPSADDGSRLQVRVGPTALSASLPDWMLVPIAHFADSPFDACVSLFGPATTDQEYDIVYHPAFQNTLLGMRLLQSDMLLFDLEQTWRLPQFGGTVVLGAGESAPRGLDDGSAQRIDGALANGSFQSWVMTDQGEPVVADAQQGRLILSGLPFYYFWSADGDRVLPVESLTNGLKAQRQALQRFNAPVYGAATNTMRYAAFFRFVKQRNPDGWRDFLSSLQSVAVRPPVVTPTAWPH